MMSQLNLCYYANHTNHIQILKVKQGQKVFWERVVFPQERLFFSASHSDELEIYGKIANQMAKIEHISCQYLFVHDGIAPVAHNFFVNSNAG
ncbi:DUF1830 domain-containing protein [[Phormidium] sp. ETS-05]|uniref:DUF1830 domain-containing protein n=1 Tax=[Phormidium] sp. ETS-05 TaxID=222819 RepID=UPI0018EEF6B7|nr:DUF1830 domain-containing protein [[Phormidium] sp. ETS-05]